MVVNIMKAILWDMDGTLVDTEPLWGIATYEMSEAMGRRISPEVRELTVGGTTENTVRLCANFADLHLSEDDVTHWVQWMFRRVGQLFDTKLPFRPGVTTVLQEALDAGIPMALVTNTARVLTDQALKTIGRRYFEVTVCGDEVSEGKPAPDIYYAASTQLGLHPDDCLVFEDSRTGMTAAYTAGCRVVGVPTDSDLDTPREVPLLRDLTGGEADLSAFNLGRVRNLYVNYPQR
ncbi:phosphoribosyl-ATP pyrophosphatase [Corynebacterium resistens DSM 45100]|uniref:Phosphoribosyl-ATP pyrophosphatase n=1 Tax=Corynebacterium resistens (strain DSM 45100 / JCM 12819 / GTC 2026 / SICGH 158) TaxID=662755 RepID=F8E273_CORRG|nr:HAD family phosphatase [Corynebacterium resistens]AEI09390.1 phosphoribosyl-ATP pyrophosphatase [Corynebacterium resistens DSM 45100]